MSSRLIFVVSYYRVSFFFQAVKGVNVPLGFPGGSDSKESTCNAGDLGSIPRLGRSPGGGHGNPLQYSCLENPHGQGSLVGYSLGSQRVRHNRATHDCVTKHTHRCSIECTHHLFLIHSSVDGHLWFPHFDYCE